MDLKKFQIWGAIFSIILGTLLHFTYELTNQNFLVGLFSAINESTWEHLKLLITPMIIFSIFEYFLYGKNIDNFFIIRAISILIGMFLIISSFYTYTGILGKNYLPLDIATFFIGVIGAYYFSYKFFQKPILTSNNVNLLGLIIIVLILFSIIYFTIQPLNINLFKDPLK